MPLPEEPINLDALADRISDRLAERVAVANSKKNLTVEHAASYCDVSQDSIRTLLSSGRLTAFRPVPGRVLISIRELDALVQASTRAPRKGRGIYSRRAGT
jgi:excisionase family DNA binding protein